MKDRARRRRLDSAALPASPTPVGDDGGSSPHVVYRDETSLDDKGHPHIVIIGAGFGGLACAKALGGSQARVTVIDRRNHHLFAPLLYQVATAALSPADIAGPIRRILARHRNINMIMGEVTDVDEGARRVMLGDGGYVPFDVLVIATGSVYNYFGHDEWAKSALNLKSISGARKIRASLLSAFERAEITPPGPQRDALMTTVVIGGGPTGVEMAGAVAELARYALARDFRSIDPRSARIVLLEAGPKLLAAFPDPLPAYAHERLRQVGVEVRLHTPVEVIEGGVVVAAGAPIEAATIVWGAGVKAAEGAGWLQASADRQGRIPVDADLAVEGRDDIFALGDVAAFEQDGRSLPALAQVAKQQGRHLGRALRARIEAGRPLPPFRFSNRGDTAVIGRHAAIYSYGRFQLTGRTAWLLWALVHVILLTGLDKRLSVIMQWIWRYLTFERGARLID